MIHNIDLLFLGEFFTNTAGGDFTPHVVTVSTGEVTWPYHWDLYSDLNIISFLISLNEYLLDFAWQRSNLLFIYFILLPCTHRMLQAKFSLLLKRVQEGFVFSLPMELFPVSQFANQALLAVFSHTRHVFHTYIPICVYIYIYVVVLLLCISLSIWFAFDQVRLILVTL